ncbi:MAG: helix-turn-helix domain-containing protein [Actinomycetota bacterium]|nr:helix-turn-helix domain-containing protein [Actinomycetota bacterium]
MSEDAVTAVTSSEPDFYGVGELASMLGVTRQAVQARVKHGTIRATKVNGAWQIPAAVAEAIVGAERSKAVASGRVTALPVSAPAGPDRVEDLAQAVVRLESRLAQVEADRVAQGRQFEQALAELHAQLHARNSEIAALREDRRRLRRALAALVSEEDPVAEG